VNYLKAKAEFVCYAPIDLKLADLYVRDGYSQGSQTPVTPAIEPVGETSIALSGMNIAVPDPAVTVGVSVKFGSDATEYTVTARTLGSGTNEVQTVEMDDDVSGGTFTLSFGGQPTGNLPYNASAAVVEAALEALSTIGLGGVSVTGSTPIWTVTFTGSLASTNVAMIVGDGSLLTGGSATDVNVAETVAGVDGVAEQQDFLVSGTWTGGSFTLTFNGETTGDIDWDASVGEIEMALEALDGIAVGEATVAQVVALGAGVGNFHVTFSGNLAGNQPQITANATNITPDGTLTASTDVAGVAAVAEVNTISINDSVSGGTFTLTQGGNTTVPILYNATAAEIEAALEAAPVSLSVSVTGGPGPATDWVVTYDNVGAQTAMTGTGTNLTGGVATAVNVTQTTAGQSGTETTNITVTPALVVATTAGGSVTFGGRKLEIKVGEGNMSYDETKAREYLKNRGRLDTVRNADEEPMDVSFEFVWEFITAVTGSGIPTLEDALKQRGEASTWLSTSSDACEPYCVDIEIHYDPGCGGNNTELIVLEQFRYETLPHSLSDAQVSCTGKCNVTEATVTRGA
jgi:hypothetical protein